MKNKLLTLLFSACLIGSQLIGAPVSRADTVAYSTNDYRLQQTQSVLDEASSYESHELSSGMTSQDALEKAAIVFIQDIPGFFIVHVTNTGPALDWMNNLIGLMLSGELPAIENDFKNIMNLPTSAIEQEEDAMVNGAEKNETISSSRLYDALSVQEGKNSNLPEAQYAKDFANTIAKWSIE